MEKRYSIEPVFLSSINMHYRLVTSNKNRYEFPRLNDNKNANKYEGNNTGYVLKRKK